MRKLHQVLLILHALKLAFKNHFLFSKGNNFSFISQNTILHHLHYLIYIKPLFEPFKLMNKHKYLQFHLKSLHNKKQPKYTKIQFFCEERVMNNFMSFIIKIMRFSNMFSSNSLVAYLKSHCYSPTNTNKQIQKVYKLDSFHIFLVGPLIF